MHTKCAEIHLYLFFPLLMFFLTRIFKDLDCFVWVFLFEVLTNLIFCCLIFGFAPFLVSHLFLAISLL